MKYTRWLKEIVASNLVLAFNLTLASAEEGGIRPLFVPVPVKSYSAVVPTREAQAAGVILDERGSPDLAAIEAKNRRLQKIEKRLKLAQDTYDGLQGLHDEAERSRLYWTRRIEILSDRLSKLSQNRTLDSGTYNYHVDNWRENARKADAYEQAADRIKKRAAVLMRLLKQKLILDIRYSKELINAADREDLPREMDRAEELSGNAYNDTVETLKEAHDQKENLKSLDFAERQDRELNLEIDTAPAQQ